MTRTLLFSILLASQVMGGNNTIDTVAQLSYGDDTSSHHFYSLPDSIVKKMYWVTDTMPPPLVDFYNKSVISLSFLPPHDTIHPGDCLTVDSNYVLIRCDYDGSHYVGDILMPDGKTIWAKNCWVTGDQIDSCQHHHTTTKGTK